MNAEPAPQPRPAAQRWGRRAVRDAPAVTPQRLAPATSQTMATTIADAKTADSPHSGGAATCDAPMAASPALTTQPGSPLSSPSSVNSGSRPIESAAPAGDYDTSPHVVVPARQRTIAPAPNPSSRPAPPAPLGMFSQWEPVASATPAKEPTPEAIAAVERSSRLAKAATVLIAVCVVAILAVIAVSAFRLTGLAELELSNQPLSNQQLSERFRTEALVWVPTVALLSALLVGAAMVRSKFAR